MSTLPCSVSDCGSPAKTRGYCGKHYTRVRKYGDPHINLIGSGRTNIDRFMSHVVEDEDGCWIWQASAFKTGYARFTPTGYVSPTYGHRWIYTQIVGQIPEGLVIRHTCNTRRCVNPKHMIPGTVRENSQDSRKAGTLIQGEKATGVRLTESQVIEIRKIWATSKPTITGLARDYGVSVGCITGVVKNINWKYLLPVD